MYLYFLPFNDYSNSKRDSSELLSNNEPGPSQSSTLPSSDGGRENTAAEFASASRWLERANAGEIILFPPQYLLLHLVSQYLDPTTKFRGTGKAIEYYKAQRQKLMHFVNTDGDPPWRDKFISPHGLMLNRNDGKIVLGLDQPGPELNGYPCKGDSERVVLVNFRKEGPRDVEVRWRKDVFEEKSKEEGSERKRLEGPRL